MRTTGIRCAEELNMVISWSFAWNDAIPLCMFWQAFILCYDPWNRCSCLVIQFAKLSLDDQVRIDIDFGSTA